ncbi:family 78 glycoside hydrolase catalytic domain [Glycomyces sp. NPDC021274]|uniref:family 78 glycoside hydrolase catalytic domain n=1 Tax=Glycomyces sp. NPDC021274 TaxID=3155120 RepID=UPI0033E77A61
MTERLPYAYALKAAGHLDSATVPTARPVLSWRVAGESHPHPQGFAIRRAATLDDLPSAPVTETNTPHAPWPGPDLRPGEIAHWQVGVCTDAGISWSVPATVEAPVWDLADANAITHPDWLAPTTWIPLPELRRTILIAATVERARLAFTGNGVVVPLIDGASGGSEQLEPGYARPGGLSPATSWDVTDALGIGTHTLTLALGSGMAFLPDEPDRYTKYRRTGEPLWVRAALHLYHRDGRVETVTTGPDWEARLSSTTVAHWYGGESYDAFAAGDWEPAVLAPAPEHAWRWAPPVQVTEVVAAEPIADGIDCRVFDLGVNAAGRPRITLTSPAEGPLTIAPAELLDAENIGVDQSTTGSPIWDFARLGPEQLEWAPSFVYHGARYLEVGGAPDDVGIDFEIMRTANEPVQTFTTSHRFLDRLHAAVDRAVQSNMYSVFTDCPHREKLGWLEQLHYCFDALARGYDVKAHLQDAVRHMIASQTATGLIPSIAPEHVVFDFDVHKGDATAFRDDPNWGRAILEVPWRLFRHYGDATAIEAAWPAAGRYLDHLGGRSRGRLLDHGLGDWVALDDSTPVGMTATWGYARAAETAAKTAAVLGDESACEQYDRLARDIWTAWRDRYRDDAGVWGSGSQASWALALNSPVLAPGERTDAYVRLRKSIEAAGAFTVGEIALPALIDALTDHGDGDLLLAIMQREDVPGYGLQLATGATALTESWQGADGNAGVLSQNHFMLGAIDAWILGHVAGLRQHAGDIGWQHVVIDPLNLREVDSANLAFESPYGRYEVAWSRDQSGVRHLHYAAPPGAVVEVREYPGGPIKVGRARTDHDRTGRGAE